MANKKNWLGILVMVLVFGMTVIGCEEEPEEEKPPFFDNVTIRVYDIPSTQNGQNFTTSLIYNGEVKTSKNGVVVNGTAEATLVWETGGGFAVITKEKGGAQYWEANIGIKIGNDTQKVTKNPVEFRIRDDITSISGSYPLYYNNGNLSDTKE